MLGVDESSYSDIKGLGTSSQCFCYLTGFDIVIYLFIYFFKSGTGQRIAL